MRESARTHPYGEHALRTAQQHRQPEESHQPECGQEQTYVPAQRNW